MKVIDDTCLYYDIIYKIKPIYTDEFFIKYIVFEELKDPTRIPDNFPYKNITYFVIIRFVDTSNQKIESVKDLLDVYKYEKFLEPVVDRNSITKALLYLI